MVNNLSIPGTLLEKYAAIRKKTNVLKMLCALKFTHVNYIPLGKLNYSELGRLFGRKDKRTINKYLRRLEELNWIGRDPNTGAIHVRGWRQIQLQFGGKHLKKNFVLLPEHLKSFNGFVCAAIVDNRSARTVKYHQRISRTIKSKNGFLMGRFALSREGAIQSHPEGYLYYGLSNEQIAKSLNCSKSTASVRKAEAKKAKLLSVRKRFQDVGESGYDPHLISRLAIAYPDLKGRFILKRSKSGKVKILRQLHDELESLLICNFRKKK